MILEFPPVETADPKSGLLACGGDLDVGSLELAYRNGIFPWPASERDPILWAAPAHRAILEFHNLHIPKRLERDLKKKSFRFEMNQNFEAVITACAGSKNRGRQGGSWITGEMISAYIRFHKAGYAHSFETYSPAGQLVGGMYGILIDHYFAGESMFYLESNASKFAFIKAIEYLKTRGLTWLDIQMLTPLLRNLGANEIPRSQFMMMLQKALAPQS